MDIELVGNEENNYGPEGSNTDGTVVASHSSTASSLLGKVGQQVKVVGQTSAHQFKIGSIVTIQGHSVNARRPAYTCLGLDNFGEYGIWWLWEEEAELLGDLNSEQKVHECDANPVK